MSQSNQEQNKKQFQLNPSAVEFVPNFGLSSASGSSTYQSYKQPSYNSNNQRYNNTQYNHQNYNSNIGHHYNNRSNHNHRNNSHHNYHNNNSHYHQPHSNYYQNNNYYYSNNNQNDVDPIELEARCEAVIEILQDDQIRDQLNPVSRFQNNQNETTNNYKNNNYYDTNQENPELDDEEDLEEMLAMQEECRLEMMKFYIQSQNPNLFEEIYHDVSYPEGVKKEETPSSKTEINSNQNQSEETSELTDSVQDHMSNLKINDQKL